MQQANSHPQVEGRYQVKALVILGERNAFFFVMCSKRCGINANSVTIHRLGFSVSPLSGTQSTGQALSVSFWAWHSNEDSTLAVPEQLQHSSEVCLFGERLSYNTYCQVCYLDKTEQEDNICWSCGCQREIK